MDQTEQVRKENKVYVFFLKRGKKKVVQEAEQLTRRRYCHNNVSSLIGRVTYDFLPYRRFNKHTKTIRSAQAWGLKNVSGK